jgi:hypothetical protein
MEPHCNNPSMPRTNPLIFKTYSYPPDGSRWLLQSSVTTRLAYTSVDELNALTRDFVSREMGIRNGSVKVCYADFELNTMYPVTEGNLPLVMNNHTLTVVVDPAAGETHSNELIFQNSVDLPDGTSRLHQSSVTTRLVYTSVDELDALTREFVSREMGIHNAFITIYFPSISGHAVDPVTSGNLHRVKDHDTLTVVVEPV